MDLESRPHITQNGLLLWGLVLTATLQAQFSTGKQTCSKNSGDQTIAATNISLSRAEITVGEDVSLSIEFEACASELLVSMYHPGLPFRVYIGSKPQKTEASIAWEKSMERRIVSAHAGSNVYVFSEGSLGPDANAPMPGSPKNVRPFAVIGEIRGVAIPAGKKGVIDGVSLSSISKDLPSGRYFVSLFVKVLPDNVAAEKRSRSEVQSNWVELVVLEQTAKP